ncbi:MAG: response regulator [Lachnospiraceae bacterium]|nr:response regulator [Lachnospiraceae bacterium]
MKVMIVDDEKLSAMSLNNTVRTALNDDSEIRVFPSGEEALADRGFQPDIAMLDIEMPGMNGLELADRLRDSFPGLIIIYVTAYSDYAMNAWNLGVDGYLLKPASIDDVRTLLDNIFAKRGMNVKNSGRLEVRCFGKFEVFYNGEIVNFKRSRAKEMLAYLICARGARVTSGELCGVLWEDASALQRKKTYIRQYAQSMREAFSQLGIEDVLVHNRDAYAVNTELVDCDYYRYLNGETDQDEYIGEFVSQYEWSELINPFVD